MDKIALVVYNLGGPDSPEAVEPFLCNLFSDPDIMNIPIAQKLVAKIISKRRAPHSRANYEDIGGKSPVNEWTAKQASAVRRGLKQKYGDIDAFVAMRYWHPMTDLAADKVKNGRYDLVVHLPLYPHYSKVTTGSSFNEWNRQFKDSGIQQLFIKNYHMHPDYIDALNKQIDEAVAKFPEEAREDIQLVFSAHSVPQKIIRKGDPYQKQIEDTVREVMNKRSGGNTHHLCYQSRVGPVKWLEPSTEETILKLAREGKKYLLIIPVSFVSDHIETLHELDIVYRALAEDNGITHYIMMEGLNCSDAFIDALVNIVDEEIEKLQNKQK